jgi:hypothetical protein
MSMELRQWCPNCQAATATWTDSHSHAHCQGCEPEATWRDPWPDDDDDDE